jgi:hypothetical protein
MSSDSECEMSEEETLRAITEYDQNMSVRTFFSCPYKNAFI